MASLKRRILEATVGRVAFRAVSIARVAEIAPAYWRIDLVGDALRKTRFTPGDKLQVSLDDGPRTYSPFAVDPQAGTLSVVSYAHGTSSGARWGPSARPGDALQVFGPRGSIPLPQLGAPIILVGDETGIGIARALHEHAGTTARYVFEATEVEPARLALEHLEIASPAVIARQLGDAHHAALVDAIRAAVEAAPGATLVLTGKASTIQAVRAQLGSTARVPQRVKAYWAPGKRGLD